MKISFKYILSCCLILATCFSFAQQSKIDSLQKILQTAKEATTRLRLYLSLRFFCNDKDDLKYGEAAVQLADKLLSQTTNDKEKKKLLKQKAMAFDYFIDRKSVV